MAKDKATAGMDVLAQVSDRVRNSNNILIALSKNPSIDELTAALSLALIFDKFGKHATAIFSGDTPNIISFLQPEKTFETNTNSLQDFIIALDKDKADHIRYKIDGDFVKVFITPYKTTINKEDLEFNHGDYNVDLVIALNVKSEEELDSALIEYGRIRHDASSINISPAAPGNFGDIEWGDPLASSVSEMVYHLTMNLQDPESPLIDENIATAILTGVISATNRFSNERTTADVMSVASNLLALGANQQLIAKNIPVDILTPKAEPTEEAAPKEAPKESAEEPVADKPKEENTKEEAAPKAATTEAQADPANITIEHQAKGHAAPASTEAKTEKAETPAAAAPKEEQAAPAQEAPTKETPAKKTNIEPIGNNAKSETDRIIAEAEQRLADEKAKAEAEEKRKRDEQAAREKAEAEKNQAAREAVVAKVNAERASQEQPKPATPPSEQTLPPQPPKEFAAPTAPAAPKPSTEAAPSAESTPAAPQAEASEPTVIPNALPTSQDNILPPPPAPFDASMMPPAVPTVPAAPAEPAPAQTATQAPAVPSVTPAPAPAPAQSAQQAEASPHMPTANEIAAEYQAKMEADHNAKAAAPVMPAVSIPSQENVAQAMSANAQANSATAPTLAPRPETTPASPTTTQPSPAAPSAPAAPSSPIDDPGSFHIPGM